MSKCIVVLSGGQDSTTCAFLARAVHDEVHCITFDYNQRHQRELESAKAIAKLIHADSHEVVSLGPVLKGKSPLTDHQATLESYENYQSMDSIIGDRVELTFVPLRNALFLTLAANRAAVLDARVIYTGVCQQDNANYPDCRDAFIRRQGAAINYALGHDKVPGRAGPWIYIETPLMEKSKAEIVKTCWLLGSRAYAALAFSHTAYDGQFPPVGNDHASVLRAHGFEEAHLPDPLILRAWAEGLMPLPTEDNYKDQSLNDAILDEIAYLAEEVEHGN